MSTVITDLPPAPSRGDDAGNFADKADAWVAALPGWTDEVNIVGGEVETNANNAATSETNAANSELAAVGAANYKGTWSSLSGALNIPASVEHSGIIWSLKYNIPDVTASVPTSSNPDWVNVSFIDENGDATIPGVLTIGSNTADAFQSGTVVLFGQAAAPIGWTKKTDWNDNAMLTLNCEVNGTALSSGGSANPQAAHSHATGSLSLTIAQLASHNHTVKLHEGGGGYHVSRYSGGTYQSTISSDIGYTGSNSTHNHGNTTTNTQPLFQEVIACIKN